MPVHSQGQLVVAATYMIDNHFTMFVLWFYSAQSLYMVRLRYACDDKSLSGLKHAVLLRLPMKFKIGLHTSPHSKHI